MAGKRSDVAHRKVLDAAITLMAERGVEGTSMDAIAEASGVSKATIYKHWSDKDQLLLETVTALSGAHARPAFESGDTRADMVEVLAYRPEGRREERDRIMPHVIAYSARYPQFGDAWRSAVMEPPRRELRRLLRTGIKNGELRLDVDVEFSLALLLGPILYQHVFQGKKPAGNIRPIAEKVVDAFWRAFARSDIEFGSSALAVAYTGMAKSVRGHGKG